MLSPSPGELGFPPRQRCAGTSTGVNNQINSRDSICFSFMAAAHRKQNRLGDNVISNTCVLCRLSQRLSRDRQTFPQGIIYRIKISQNLKTCSPTGSYSNGFFFMSGLLVGRRIVSLTFKLSVICIIVDIKLSWPHIKRY